MSPESLLPMADLITAWIITFALHSTVFLGLAWLLSSVRTSLPDAFRDAIWKISVLAALLTSSCQLALVAEPAAGYLAHIGSAPVPLAAEPELSRSGFELPAAGTAVNEAVLPDRAQAAGLEGGSSLPGWFLLAAGVASMLALGHGLISARAMRRILRQRRALRDGPAPAMLGRLCAKAGYWRAVRLSSHSGLQTAIAFGVLRPEICLPVRAFAELDEGQQQSMLAHELGHLMRRDPLWLRLTGMLVVLFPWQPLLRVARRELQILAEYRSDAFAARLNGNLAAARCLLEVAGWVTARQQTMPMGVTSMAVRGSAFKERIERLLQGERPGRIGRHKLWLLPVSTLLLATATTVLPGADVRVAGEREIVDSTADAGDADTSIRLLGSLIEQMEFEFTGLRDEVALLREELGEKPMDEELASMLAALDAKLDSLERHRELFLGVMKEWMEPELDEFESDTDERTEPSLRGESR